MAYYGLVTSFLCLIPLFYFIIHHLFNPRTNWILIYLSYAVVMELLGAFSYFLKLEFAPDNSIYQSITIEIPLLYSMFYFWSKDRIVVTLGLINSIYWAYCALFTTDINLTLGGCLVIELISESYLLVRNKDWLLSWQFYIILGFIFYNSVGIFNFGFVDFLIKHNLTLSQFLQGFANIGLYSIMTYGLMQCKKQLSAP